jgi:hypothetical protein
MHETANGSSLAFPCNRQGPKESLSLHLTVCPVPRNDGRSMSRSIDRDDALVRDQRLNEANRLAIVIFVDDHHVPPSITLRRELPNLLHGRST